MTVQRAAWMAVLAVVVACAGGTDTPDAGPGGAGGRVQQYASVASPASADALVQRLDTEGLSGFRYLGPISYSGDGLGSVSLLFVKDDATATYTYRLSPSVSGVDAFLAQLNTSGAEAYRFAGLETRGVLLRRQIGRTAGPFTYRLEPAGAPQTRTAATFLQQANAQGAGGYRFVGELVLDGGFHNLYEQDATSSARYAFEARQLATSDTALLADLDAEGARGFRVRGPVAFSDGMRWLYERDTAQASAFTYATRPTVTTSAALVAQANTEGAAGRGFLGELLLPGGAKNLYFAATACTGPLCDARGPFGP